MMDGWMDGEATGKEGGTIHSESLAKAAAMDGIAEGSCFSTPKYLCLGFYC